MNNKIPHDCKKCQYYKTCNSFFGAKGCKFEKEIIKKIVEDYKKGRF